MTETRKIDILGISGSLRLGSYNTELIRVAAEEAPPNMSIELADISELPFYNADLEREQGFPEPVAVFREAIDRSHGLLIATPEYNWSVTGVLKNAIDWASRRPSPLDHKPAAILGTGGRSGTARSQDHLRDILGHNQLRVVDDPQVMLPRARLLFETGTLRDRAARDVIRALLDALKEKVEQTVVV